jgi:integrase
MLAKPLPRFVIAKPLADGSYGFYFTVPTYHRKQGCTIPNERLGSDYVVACGNDGDGGRAAALNGLFDEWRARATGEPIESIVRYGTVDWLFREYKSSKAYLEKVSKRSRPDYERTMLLVADILTRNGDRIGSRLIRSITPRGADKIYEKIIIGVKGKRLRQGEKAVALCRKAWKVVRRLYPDEFDNKTPNPWEGVTRERRVKKKKPAVTREQVYAFAQGCIERGHPESAAAAVICFEWLQRPENVLAGYLRWTDYRSKEWPTAIRIEHHKTGELVWHPLEETVANVTTKFYEDAEAILAKLPRRGVPMILREVIPPSGRSDQKPTSTLFSISGFQKIVQRLRADIGLPSTFTLDACRHGGMTELEVAELTDGQGRALSGHKTTQAYAGYAKQTLERALPATRKRHAHRLGNVEGTKFQNIGQNLFQNDAEENNSGTA